jgi:hypothetical protein
MKKEADGYATRSFEHFDIQQPSAANAGGEVISLFPGRAIDRGECDVERINQYATYDLGKLFSRFVRTQQDVSSASAFYDVMQARGTLHRLLMEGVPMQLGLSRGPAQELLRSLDAIFDAHFSEIKDNKQTIRFPDTNDPPIPSWRWDSAAYALERFETVLQEELREATTYFVPQRGIYSTAALVDGADRTFPEEISAFIPQKALSEWRSAGRCLAFNLLSASGFHVARAVESGLESYYQFYCKKPGKTLRSWHDYIEALTKVSNDPKPDPKTLAELKQMKEDYRNPIVHPRVVLSEADARMLFNNGESLVIAMAQELKQATASMSPSPSIVPFQAPKADGQDGAQDQQGKAG